MALVVMRKILVKIKGKISVAFLVSFLSLILFFFTGGIIVYSLVLAERVPYNYHSYVVAFFLFAFPLSGAYAVFCLCYSGKLFIKRRISALMAHLLIILIVYIAVPKDDFDIERSSKTRPLDAAIAELNGRESLRWAKMKVSGRQFQTDAEIDKEIVYGKSHDGWDNDLGRDYTWSVAPTATGGTLLYKSREGWVLYRTPATLEKGATRGTGREVPLPPVVGHYACVGVESGDTIIVIHNGTRKGLRLMGIDAPQVSFCENETGQPFSRESADYLADMVLNKNVKTVLYKLEGGYRSLGVVFVEDKNVNLEMIKAGLAEVDLRNRFPGFDLEPYINSEKESSYD